MGHFQLLLHSSKITIGVFQKLLEPRFFLAIRFFELL
jgi:hypothetical protein